MTSVASKRRTLDVPWVHGIYDMSPPLVGCDSVMVFHLDDGNHVFELANGHAGRELYEDDNDDPDETIRSLGYWVVVK